MMRKRLFAMVLALAMCLSLAACGGDTTDDGATDDGGSADTTNTEAAEGGTITYALAAGWDTLTPGYWCTAGYYGTVIWSQLYDKLVDVSENGYTPRGAVSWETNEDKTVMTFKLNEDAKFSDGEPVTAQDWVFSAKLLATADFGAPDYSKLCVVFAGTDETGLVDESQEFGVKALDDYTLQITFKEAMTFDTFFNSYQHSPYVLPEH